MSTPATSLEFCPYPGCGARLHPQHPGRCINCGRSWTIAALDEAEINAHHARTAGPQREPLRCVLRSCSALLEVPVGASPERIEQFRAAHGWCGNACGRDHADAVIANPHERRDR